MMENATNKTVVMATTTPTTSDNSLTFDVGKPLFYVVVGAGATMSFLLLVILVLCVCIGCLASRKKRAYTVPNHQPTTQRQSQNQLNRIENQERQISDQQQQLQVQAAISEPTASNSQPQNRRIQEYDTVTDNERGAEHAYAVVDESQKGWQLRPIPASVPIVQRSVASEQPNLALRAQSGENLSRATTNPLSVTLRKSKSHDDFLNQDDESNPHRQRPSSWSSPNEPVEEGVVERSSRLYDSISPSITKVNEKEKQASGYNKLIYEGYTKKQQPPPQLDNGPLAALYSKLSNDRSTQATSATKNAASTSHDTKNQTMVTNKSESRPRDVNVKGQMGYPMKELLPPSQTGDTGPLYSNVNDDMKALAQSESGLMYSVPDMKKKRKDREAKRVELTTLSNDMSSSPLYSNVAAERSTMNSFQTDSEEHPQPLSSLPNLGKTNPSQHHQTVIPISDPLYSNLSENKSSLVQSTTETAPTVVYSIPDMQRKWEGRQIKKEQLKKLDQQRYQDYPMMELEPQHETVLSSPLYSNSNAEMHPILTTQSPNLTETYDVPNLTKYREGNRAMTHKDTTRGVQHTPYQEAASPSPPPLPPQSFDFTESLILGEQATTFGVREAMYPHVSVPASVRRGSTAKASAQPDPANIYDHPSKKDIYKPLPLEGLYDVPSSMPKRAYEGDVECNHYDMPSSLSLVAASCKDQMEGSMPGTFPRSGDEERSGTREMSEQ